VEVTREVVLEAPLEEVWEALTDPEQVEEWFSEDGEARELVIEEVERGTRVVVRETGEPGWNAVFSLRSLASVCV
jgi:uncharacterized protein YndB with AHSA1/START domain